MKSAGYLRPLVAGSHAVAGSMLLLGLCTLLGGLFWLTDIAASVAAPVALLLTPLFAVMFKGWKKISVAMAVAGLAMVGWIMWQRSDRAQHESAHGSTIRVLVLNAWSENPTPDRVLEALELEDPDVAVIMECPPSLVTAATGGTGVFARYPVRERRHPNDPWNAWAFVLSRWPVADAAALKPAGGPAENPFPISVVLQFPQGALHVIGLQCASPRTSERWAAGNEVARRASILTHDSVSRGMPVVVAGDLNSSPTAGRELILRRAGLRRCKPFHRAMGTFPAFAPWPFQIAIDDAWISDRIGVVSWRTLKGTGSDHLGVVLEIHLREKTLSAASPG